MNWFIVFVSSFTSLSALETSLSDVLLCGWDVVTDADLGICVEKKA